MYVRRLFLISFLGFFTCSLQAWDYSDIVKYVAVTVGVSYPTEMVDGVERIVLTSYQAYNLLQKNTLIKQKDIPYKIFKTLQGDIKTLHIVDGYQFQIRGHNYIVRSFFHNTNEKYKTHTSLFGYQQIAVQSDEALAIMNDSKYLTHTDYNIVNFFISVHQSSLFEYNLRPLSGYLLDGSIFTSNDIHYIVKNV